MSDSLSHTLGRTRTVLYKGKTYNLEPLDLNDIAEIEDRIGDISNLDPRKPKMLRLLLWLVIRKSDPTLTEEQKRYGDYNLTEHEAGSLIPLKGLGDEETKKFVLTIMRQSGLVPEEEEAGAAKNDEAGTGNQVTASVENAS